ncbi:MAG: DUF262 domain-containing protein [Gammaproteobacteria bacterium]|nr:MAG: DUF262 domain-containing protein [Gammaproteobacteria bacterium]
MKHFDSRPYSIADFIEWRDSGLLNLSPDFQRRAVWTEKAKSYLIDTILRQKPVPKLIVAQELQGNRSVRVVVDGQQRLRAIFGFFDGDFKISKAHNEELAGYTYESLPAELRKSFLKYELAVDILFDPEYKDLLDIFARINTYTVILKKQEKLNAEYVGYFKQYAFRLGIKYVDYLLNAKVITKAQITRMVEAELAGDLLMNLVGGIQTNKNIENYYKRFEEEEGDLPRASRVFDDTMSWIGAIYPGEEMSLTNWSRQVLFYTLFISIAHLNHGVKGADPQLRVSLKPAQVGRLRIKLDELSAKWEEIGKDWEKAPIDNALRKFVSLSRRATTDTTSRVGRVNYLSSQLKQAVEQ